MTAMEILLAMVLQGLALPLMADGTLDSKPLLLAAASAVPAMADGEVRRIDKEAAKVTLRHGPMPNLDMPPMTMVFRVKDPAMLDRVKVGDKIRFEAAHEGGAYVVIHMEPAK
jgi:Cu(I)/Ag(I) efflux system periplasmic protein CusF